MSTSESEGGASDQHQHVDDAGGLFGSGSEDEASGIENVSNKRRKLDDAELDSGDSESKLDRTKDDMFDEEEDQTRRLDLKVFDTSIGRHTAPQPSDGELYLLQFPNHIGINPKAFTLDDFEPPATEHHASGPASSNFSAYGTSNNTIRWRHSPSNPAIIQSNARINRWSDGSLTLQLASNPGEQFELAAKPLAQPQSNPIRPTPTAINANRSAHNVTSYNSRLDSHTYLAAPHEKAGLVRHTNHITASLAVQSSDQDDDALLRLQQSLAAATKGNKNTADGGLEVISITEDPELAKKRAELAEKEKIKLHRRMQIQQDRETSRANNILKRSGLRTGGMGTGLTVGGLEDEDGMAATKGRAAKPKARRARRRNSEYSDDEEDFRGRGRNREDEYDEDDGFLIGSDEEPEVVEDASEEEVEVDAEGDEDETIEKPKKPENEGAQDGATGGRQKRRRVIDDEDE